MTRSISLLPRDRKAFVEEMQVKTPRPLRSRGTEPSGRAFRQASQGFPKRGVWISVGFPINAASRLKSKQTQATIWSVGSQFWPDADPYHDKLGPAHSRAHNSLCFCELTWCTVS